MKRSLAVFAGTALVLGGCSSTPERPVVEPQAGIVVEKIEDSQEVCYNTSDMTNIGGECDVLYSGTTYTYTLRLGACSVNGDVVALADDAYLRSAAADPAKYPVKSEGLAPHVAGMDPNQDYTCSRDVTVGAEQFAQIAEHTYYAVS